MKARTIICMMLLIIAPGALAQDSSSKTNIIQITGTGNVAIVPNAFTVTFVLEQKGLTITKLNSQLQNDLTQLTEFLLKHNVSEKNIQSMQIRLHQRYESGPEGRVENGYVLSREVTITHNKIDEYDRLIDGALKRGVTKINRFELIASDPQKAYEKALINAVSDAKSKAALLASQLGVKIGQVTQISEGYTGNTMPENRVAMAINDAAGNNFPGQQQLEATVNATFTLIQ